MHRRFQTLHCGIFAHTVADSSEWLCWKLPQSVILILLSYLCRQTFKVQRRRTSRNLAAFAKAAYGPCVIPTLSKLFFLVIKEDVTFTDRKRHKLHWSQLEVKHMNTATEKEASRVSQQALLLLQSCLD